MLPADRWALVEELFNAVADLPPADRDAYLDARATDPEIRREVDSLLAADANPSLPLSIAAEAAADFVDAQSHDSLVGRVVDGYRIESLVGVGGMGEVYAAEEMALGRRVALKRLPLSVSANGERVRRLVTEAKAASALNHPNIVTVFRIGEHDGRQFIVSEFVDGETLRRRLARGPMTADEAVGVARQVASALAAAHEAGIVHRDVKPENIMIRPDGLVKVLDFGIAKIVDTAIRAAPKTLTRVGVVMGTPDYMAPEQAAGRAVDARADIFSLGVVLYEMLTGELPGRSGVLPPRFVSIVKKALASDPAARFQTAEAFRDQLPLADASRSPRLGATSRWIAAALCALVLGSAGTWWIRSRALASRAADGSTPVASLVVMPFASITPQGSDQAYLEVGMADAVIARLVEIQKLSIPPIAAIRRQESPLDAARRFRVDAVLTGSVQRAEDRIRVTVQLSSASDGREIWASRFDERFTDIFSVQDRIAEQIAARLVRDITARDRASLHRRETNNVEAYEQYLRGRERWNRRTTDAIRTAIQMYEGAIALDPGFALAYAGLADAYSTTASGFPPSVAHPLAKAAAEQALSLGPNLAEPHVAAAYVAYKYEWNWAAAAHELEEAIAIDPASSLAHHQYGELHKVLGEWDQAIDEFQRARRYDPYLPHTRADLEHMLLFVGRVSEARALIEDGLKLDPASWEMHQGMAEVLAAEGRTAESIDEDIQARTLRGEANGDELRDAFRRGGADGYRRKQIALLEAKFDQQETTPRSVTAELAMNYALLHDRARTLKWLDVAADRGEDAVLYLHYPEFDFLRGDPRFDALTTRVFGQPRAAVR